MDRSSIVKLCTTGLLGLLSALACSCDGAKGTADAAVDSPAGPAAEMITCPQNITREVSTQVAAEYVPKSQTVRAGTIVRFSMDPSHSARSNDGLFDVGFGQVECVRFNKPSTYTFGCTSHGFLGEVVVQ